MAKDLKTKAPTAWEARKLKAAQHPRASGRPPVFGKRGVAALDRSPPKR